MFIRAASRLLVFHFVLISLWTPAASAQTTCTTPPVPALGTDTVQHVSGAICARETCQAQKAATGFGEFSGCGFSVERVVVGTEEILCGAYSWAELPFPSTGSHKIIGCCPERLVAQADGSCAPPVFDDGMGPPLCKLRGDGGNPWASPTTDALSAVPAGVGDPINLTNGNQYVVEEDIAAGDLRYPGFARHYNSNPYTEEPSTLLTPGPNPWRTSWDFAVRAGSGDTFRLERPNGRVLTFRRLAGGIWADARGNETSAFQELSGGGFAYSTDGQRTETYDAEGRLLRIAEADGRAVELTHGPFGPVEIRTSFGGSLSLSYDAFGRLDTVTDGAGRTFRYGFGETGRLASVTAPDGGVREYLYEDASDGRLLTGIVGETGERVATFGYLGGLAVSSEGPGGGDRVEVAYAADGTATVTDAFGKQTVYRFQRDTAGRAFLTDVQGQPIGDCLPADTAYSLDDQGRPMRAVDAEGAVTLLSYNAEGLLSETVRAAGTAEERFERVVHVPGTRLVSRLEENGRRVDFIYDSEQRLTSRTETDTASGQRRTTAYAYDGPGNLISIDGPRTTVADVTTMTYDAAGNLASITDALGKASIYGPYDASGRLLAVRGPDGVVTTMTYDAAGRLATTTKAGATTTLSYDLAGRLVARTLPDGSATFSEYDEAGRLIAESNNLGDRVEITRNVLGGVERQETKDATGAVTQVERRLFDELNRLRATIGADPARQTTFTYDRRNDLQEIRDPLGGLTRFTRDALGRVRRTVHPLGGAIDEDFDARGERTVFEDSRNVTTADTYNAFGELISRDSPDSGRETFDYDAAGNLVRATDARGVVRELSYDALNRLLRESYPGDHPDGPGADVTYTWDDCPFGDGRLCAVSDASGTISYAYDARGNRVSERRTFAGFAGSFEIRRAYDPADRVVETVYPSGRIVRYGRDEVGRIREITTRAGAGEPEETPEEIVLTDVRYLPFGPAIGWTSGNGLTTERAYDGDYRLRELRTFGSAGGVQDLIYELTARDEIAAITDHLDAERGESFTYDPLGRLATAAGPYGDARYQYDAAGNRVLRAFSAIESPTGSTGPIIEPVLVVESLRAPGAYPQLALALGADFDLSDQLALSRAARDLALARWSPAGAAEDLLSPAWSGNVATLTVPAALSASYGYELNADAIRFFNQRRLIFHTDETVARRNHDLCESPDNFGVISGAMSGSFIQCPVTDWGRYFVVDASELFAGDSLVERYRYDEASNRLLEVSTVENGASAGSRTFTYTASGDAATDTVAGSARELRYDARGRLAEISENGEPLARYAYDALGRRARKETARDPDASRRYFWDGEDRLLAELDDDGSFAREILYLDDLRVAVVAAGSAGLSEPGSASEQVVDNLSPGFAASGAWVSSQAVPGFEGVNYRYTAHNGSVLLDNLLAFVPGESRVEIVGSWPTSSRDAGFLFENYAAKFPGDGSAFVRWSLGDEPAGRYRILGSYTSNPDLRASDAPYTVAHLDSAGEPTTTTVRVDQRTGGGTLFELGVFDLDSASAVTLSDDADGPVVADAVIFEPLDAIYDPAVWTFTVEQSGRQDVYASWSAAVDRTPAARYTITRTRADGATATAGVVRDQRGSSEGFAYLTSIDAEAGDLITVELSNLGPPLLVVADAVKLVAGASESTPGGLFFVHGDHLGTPQVITDGSGEEVWRATHQPFGRATASLDRLADDQRFNDQRFTGQQEDFETGLFYNVQRSTYDPDLGRYLESDPIGLQGGPNPYLYAEANPLRFVDPNGLAPKISDIKQQIRDRKQEQKRKKEEEGEEDSGGDKCGLFKFNLAFQKGQIEGTNEGGVCLPGGRRQGAISTRGYTVGDGCDLVRAVTFQAYYNSSNVPCCKLRVVKIPSGWGFDCPEDPLAGIPDGDVCGAV